MHLTKTIELYFATDKQTNTPSYGNLHQINQDSFILLSIVGGSHILVTLEKALLEQVALYLKSATKKIRTWRERTESARKFIHFFDITLVKLKKQLNIDQDVTILSSILVFHGGSITLIVDRDCQAVLLRKQRCQRRFPKTDEFNNNYATENSLPQITVEPVINGDMVLLGTKAILDWVSNDDIEELVKTTPIMKDFPERLLKTARGNGGIGLGLIGVATISSLDSFRVYVQDSES